MTLESVDVFANHKGGCGKTVLLFHTACQYAKHHPQERVFVMDMTVIGDISRLLLGGDVYESKNLNGLEELAEKYSTSILLEEAAQGVAKPSSSANSKKRESSFYLHSPPPKGSSANAGNIEPEKYMLQVSEINTYIPSNLFLTVGGGSKEQLVFDEDGKERIVATLKDSLHKDSISWKVFIDTDGDLTFSGYTQIALCFADKVVIPLMPSYIDFRRVSSFLEEFYGLQESRNGNAKILGIVWNNVDSQKNEPWKPFSNVFTPTNAVKSVIKDLNTHLAKVAQHFSQIFYHPLPDDTQEEDKLCEMFSQSSSLLMRNFGVTGMASTDCGIPFCSMTKGELIGSRMKYQLNEESIKNMCLNIQELLDKLS
ncbi:hypothetical protein GpartN1_g1271.t1 [Galdieria partita]|uniref:CobQ/CobB/MinD/ParA nucleotide binding domain-containing protein n=1 Tax=Galdieria partita TaxID=83374 RepID=A0A9C7PS35_9RHOD|nr:hypothetical protein GpartN1_g1271.t1 [Galdieria partita]